MKRTFARDFIVYFLSSIRYLLLRGNVRSFVYDVSMYSEWRRYKLSEKNALDAQIPWMCFEVIRYLGNWLNRQMIVFEYGSGGSTIFLSKRVKMLSSVEYDSYWYKEVNAVLSPSTLADINYHLILPEQIDQNEKEDCGNPDAYLSCMGAYKGLRFQKYAQAIEKHADESFDLVIIDGRARPSCIKHALPKIKKGGVLLVDNADRGYYLQPFPELSDTLKWEERSFTGHTPFGLTSVLYSTKLFIKK